MKQVKQTFQYNWEYIIKEVESEARHELATIGHIDYQRLTNLLQSEIKHWSGEDHPNAILCSCIDSSLHSLRHIILSFLISIISAIAVIAIMYFWFTPTLWQYIAFPLLFMVLTYTLLQPIVNIVRQKAIEEIISTIKLELTMVATTLNLGLV